MLRRYTLLVLNGLLLLLFSMTTNARTNINLDIALSSAPPAPPSQVVMAPPQGFNNCYTTGGGWMGNVWVPPHQECQYAGAMGPTLWVSGYWGCLAVGPDGSCGRWKWYGHRWARGPQMVGYNNNHGYYHNGREFHHRHW